MVIGMSGVGKSATINSLLDAEEAAPTNAFEPGTSGVKEINGTVAGVRVKFIDTPGLQPSAANIGSNQRLLNQMHGAFKKHKPDIMLYMDRADVLRYANPACRVTVASFHIKNYIHVFQGRICNARVTVSLLTPSGAV